MIEKNYLENIMYIIIIIGVIINAIIKLLGSISIAIDNDTNVGIVFVLYCHPYLVKNIIPDSIPATIIKHTKYIIPNFIK